MQNSEVPGVYNGSKVHYILCIMESPQQGVGQHTAETMFLQ